MFTPRWRESSNSENTGREGTVAEVKIGKKLGARFQVSGEECTFLPNLLGNPQKY